MLRPSVLIAILALLPLRLAADQTADRVRRLCARGDAMDARSDSAGAEKLARAARELAHECGDPASEARALCLLGKTFDSRDRLAPAREAYEAAYRLAVAAGDPELIATALAGIGTERIRGGEAGQTAELLEALQLANELRNDRIAAMALLRLGQSSHYAGNYVEALRKYEECWRRAAKAKDLVLEASATGGAGLTYDYMNNHRQANKHVLRAVALFRRAGNLPGVIRYLRNLADMEIWQNHPAKAEKYLREVERLLPKAPNDRTSAYVAATRSTMALLTDDLEGADRAARRGIELARKVQAQLLVTVLTQQLARIRVRQKRYDEAIPLAKEAIERATNVTPEFDVYWHARIDLGNALAGKGQIAAGLREMNEAAAAIEGTSSSVPPENDDQLDFLFDKTEPYYEAFRILRSKPEEAIQWVERVRSRRLIEVLARRRGLARSDIPRPASAEIHRMIPEDGAVVMYVVLNDTTYVGVLTRDAASRIHTIPISIDELQKRARRLLALLSARSPDYPAASRRMYDLLLKPIERELRGKRILCINGDALLTDIPFQALAGPDGFFAEHHAVFYTPSLTFLAWRARHPDARQKDAPLLLAFGNPRISEETASKARSKHRDESLGPLPEAEQEVRSLASIYGASEVTLRIGAEATEAAFRSEAGRYRILHLATHGMVDDRNPMDSHLVLSRAPRDANDGLLEARELVDLPLHADLAVLSACDTARGGPGGGEGKIGLSWALLAAGCRNAVLSQVKVESKAARDLMIAFHRRFARGESAAEALHGAELAMMHARGRSHPFYWAPFIVVGTDW